MGDRLSDKEIEIAELLVDADDWSDDDIGEAACVLGRCLAELRERRAADLTSEDVDTLQYLKCFAEEAHEAAAALRGMNPELADMAQRSIALLDKLLARGGK